MLNPWVILGLVVAWLASMVAVGRWQHEQGAVGERSAWQARENTELVAANVELELLQKAAQDDHRKHELSLAAIGTELSKEKTANEDLRRNDRALALSGGIRLRLPPIGQGAGACGGDPAATGAGRGDGPAPGELPREVAADLLDLANDADQVAEQLAACQAVIRSDRKDAP